MKPLCIVSCPIDCYSGYSARSRDFVKALIEKKGKDWDIKILIQRWGNTPFGYIEDHHEDWGWLKQYYLPNNQMTQQPDYWFQITIPSEFQPMGKWNCGVTAGIETNVCHPTWIEGCNRMNLVVVPSKHSKDVFVNTKVEYRNQATNAVTNVVELKTPVEILFEGVDTEKFYHLEDDDIPENPLVEKLDEVSDEFCFLFVGHWLPGILGEDRKNVGGMIKSFLETFKNRRVKPALILKTNSGSCSILDRVEMLNRIEAIKNTVDSKNLPNIYLLHGDIKEEEMNYLYNHPKVKVMISLTKGEGYGRPLLEFTQAKKPILASGWSGHLDFLNPEWTFLLSGNLTSVHESAMVKDMLVPEAVWFTPNILQVHEMLLEVYDGYSKYVEGAKRQAYHNKKEFSLERMAEELEKLLDKNVVKFETIKLPNLKQLKLPKLSKTE